MRRKKNQGGIIGNPITNGNDTTRASVHDSYPNVAPKKQAPNKKKISHSHMLIRLP